MKQYSLKKLLLFCWVGTKVEHRVKLAEEKDWEGSILWDNYEITSKQGYLWEIKDRLSYIEKWKENVEADSTSFRSFKSLGKLKVEGLHI